MQGSNHMKKACGLLDLDYPGHQTDFYEEQCQPSSGVPHSRVCPKKRVNRGAPLLGEGGVVTQFCTAVSQDVCGTAPQRVGCATALKKIKD